MRADRAEKEEGRVPTRLLLSRFSSLREEQGCEGARSSVAWGEREATAVSRMGSKEIHSSPTEAREDTS